MRNALETILHSLQNLIYPQLLEFSTFLGAFPKTEGASQTGPLLTLHQLEFDLART